jgi:hypothetical protein
MCGPSLTETMLCGAYLYFKDIFVFISKTALIPVEIMRETLVFTSQRTQSVFIIRTSPLMLFLDIIELCCKNGTYRAVWSEC